MAHPHVDAGLPSVDEFHAFVLKVFGARGGAGKKQKPTAAMGFIKGQRGLYLVVQKGAVSDAAFTSAVTEWRARGWEATIVQLEPSDFADSDSDSDRDDEDTWLMVDSSHLAASRVKKGERTGFHAEMLVVRAMMSANNWKAGTLAELRTYLRGSGGAMIVANAQACKHCGHFMDGAEIEYAGEKGDASLTGWWNPLTDRVYPHGSAEFGRNVPGV